jgi:hypothetical protein
MIRSTFSPKVPSCHIRVCVHLKRGELSNLPLSASPSSANVGRSTRRATPRRLGSRPVAENSVADVFVKETPPGTLSPPVRTLMHLFPGFRVAERKTCSIPSGIPASGSRFCWSSRPAIAGGWADIIFLDRQMAHIYLPALLTATKFDI